MPHFDKHFTLYEANQLLPRIREIFDQIHSLIDDAKKGVQPPIPHPDKLSPGRTNGDHKKQKDSPQTHFDISKKINELIAEIADQGIVIQDVYRGLIDFPTMIHGDEVFFCYELADGDTIQFWHPIDTGFSGRQPIPEDIS